MKKLRLLLMLTCMIITPKLADAAPIKFESGSTDIKKYPSFLIIDFSDYINTNNKEAEIDRLKKEIEDLKKDISSIIITNANQQRIEEILDFIKFLRPFENTNSITFSNCLNSVQEYQNFINEYIQPHFPKVKELLTITDGIFLAFNWP